MLEVEDCGNGFKIVACMYCDLPQDDGFVYENHCWNCGNDIDSRNSKQSVLPNMGYHCNSCGKDLSEWKGIKQKTALSDGNFKKLLDKVEAEVNQRKKILSAIMTTNISDESFKNLLSATGAY